MTKQKRSSEDSKASMSPEFATPLKEVRIRNFKSIKDGKIPLGRLTAVVGANSAGKSSLIQSILVMSQTAEERDDRALVPLVGRQVALGSFADVAHFDSRKMSLGATFCPADGSMRDPMGNSLGPPQAEISWDIDLVKPPTSDSSYAAISEIRYEVEINENGPRPGRIELKAVLNRQESVSSKTLLRSKGRTRDHRRRAAGRVSVDALALRGGLPEGAFRKLKAWEFLFDQVASYVADFEQSRVKRANNGRRRRATSNLSQPKAETALELIKILAVSMSPDEWEILLNPAAGSDAPVASQDMRFKHEVLYREFMKLDREEAANSERKVSESKRKRLLSAFEGNASATREDVRALVEELATSENEYRMLTKDVYGGLTGFHDRDLSISAQIYMLPFLANVRHIGPLRSFPSRRGAAGVTRTDIGSNGEYAFAVLHRNSSKEVARPIAGSVQDRTTAFLGDAVDEWLSHIGVASSVDTSDDASDGFMLTARRTPEGPTRDLTELGVGVSQVLPVVLACLLTEPGQVVMLEQPELHLHPAMQIRLAEFLVACARSGRQVIVETHSEYLINRLRRSVVEDDDANQLIELLFAEQDDQGATQFRSSTIDGDGNLSEDWPSGFLDVAADEAFELLRSHLGKFSDD